MKKQTIPMSLMVISKKVKAESIRFDLEVQRRSVWNLKQKQDLIDSLIFDLPVPPLYFVDRQDKLYWCLDGQQRARTVAEYMNDEFALNDNLRPLIDDDNMELKFEIAGLKYSELPDEVRVRLNSTNLSTYTFSNITEEEIRNIFRRLNSNTAFKKIELTRIEMDTEVMKFINEIADMPFFKEKIRISDKLKNHFADHEVILQSFNLLLNDYAGFTGRDLEKFTSQLNEIALEDGFKNKVRNIAQFLGIAYSREEDVKYLKKVNVPIIFKMAELVQDISPANFKLWTDEFFADVNDDYREACKAGSAKKDNVRIRLDIMKKNFKEKFETEQEVKKPTGVDAIINDLVTGD